MRESVIFANTLIGSETNIIYLPERLNKYNKIVVVSASIPKSWYNIRTSTLTIDATPYVVTAGIYNVYSLKSFINNLTTVGMTYNAATLKYSFNSHNFATSDHELALALGINNNNTNFTQSTSCVSFQPYSVLNIICNQLNTPNHVLASVFTENTPYGSTVFYNPQADNIICSAPLQDLDSNFISVSLHDHDGLHVDLNGLYFSMTIKLYQG